MTLLNKPFKKPREKENIDEQNEELKKPDINWFGFWLWTMTIFIILSVLGTLSYSILLFNKESEVDPLSALALTEITYSTMPRKAKVYSFNESVAQKPDFSNVNASSIYAFNPISQQIYYQSNEDQTLSIASITKLLSILIASEHFEPTDILTVTDRDLSEVEWQLGLTPGDKISYEDAVNAMLIGSYNDVAYVVAENHPEGFEGFMKEMNLKAQMIGMENSNFVNPAGLDDEDHYSTARDLKRLIYFVLQDELIIDIVKKSSEVISIDKYISVGSYITDEITIKTTNDLLNNGDNTVAGLKTGYTSAAGQSFIGYFKGVGDDQLITIILNASYDRFEETEELVENIRRNY